MDIDDCKINKNYLITNNFIGLTFKKYIEKHGCTHVDHNHLNHLSDLSAVEPPYSGHVGECAIVLIDGVSS